MGNDEILPIFEIAQKEIYSLMEMDSMPKFLRSEKFKKISESKLEFYH
jgi:hypothetical protein